MTSNLNEKTEIFWHFLQSKNLSIFVIQSVG